MRLDGPLAADVAGRTNRIAGRRLLVLLESQRDRACLAALSEFRSMMMEFEDEEEMQLCKHGDYNRRVLPHPMLTKPC